MYKRAFLFISTILVAISASTGYDASDFLKGTVHVTTFLDWFSHAEKELHIKGLIVLDLIPLLFLSVQIILFFKDNKKGKGIFAILALLANLIGVFLVIQCAYPIASQIASWTPESLPSDWVIIKDDWLNYIGLHGLMGLLGWLFFVITYFISDREDSEIIRLPRILNFFKNALLFFLIFLLGLSSARLYGFCFFSFQYEISGVTFIEMHRPLDLAIRKAGPILFTVILSIHVLLSALFFGERSSKKGWLIITAIIFLLCDTFIALRYNRPLNDLFLTWTPTTLPVNWKSMHDEWLSYHLYRDVFMILGFASILLTFFVKKKAREIQTL